MVLLICSTASAQHIHRTEDGLTYGGGGYGDGSGGGFGASLNVGYDTPLGDLKNTFKGSPTFAFSLVKNIGPLTFNGTFGYASFKPKADTTYYYTDVATQTIGSLAYSNFKTIQLYVGAAYNAEITEGVNLYFGLNLGAYLVHYSYFAGDEFGTTSYDTQQTDLYVAPKFGAKFDIDENFSISIEGKYNFFKPSAGSNGASTSFEKTIGGSFGVTYIF